MSEYTKLTCCNKTINVGELWFLPDFKDFTSRKLYIGKCKVCGDDAALEIIKNKNSGNTYYNLYNGIEAVKVIYRAKKIKIATFPNLQATSVYGWVYGVNVEIKNKQGNTAQIRQYSFDFKGKRVLSKKIYVKH